MMRLEILDLFLVAYMTNGTDKQGCVVVENSFGSIRTGDYSGTPSGTLGNTASDNCQ